MSLCPDLNRKLSTVYNEDEFVQLSGIQHFAFCRRQWALIHVEGQWAENARTACGKIFHERAHDASLAEKRGDLLTVRGLRVFSSTLGVSGECDVVEFRRDGQCGVPLRNYDGLWSPMPVEYKSGASKISDADRLQLCLQAICLEEMLGCPIHTGCLYYGETRRRERVELDEELRRAAKGATEEMHAYLRRGYTPKVKTCKHCNACSLREVCLPALCRNLRVDDYIADVVGKEEEPCGTC